MTHADPEAQPPATSVLLVEDDAGLRNALAVCLRIAGFSVDTAGDERSALDRFQRLKPSVIVSDLLLPDGEGMSAVRQMHAAAPEVPIVVISGGGWFAANDLLGMARSLGASAAMCKPFKPAALVELVRTLEAAA